MGAWLVNELVSYNSLRNSVATHWNGSARGPTKNAGNIFYSLGECNFIDDEQLIILF